jgi:hypothetical protein
VYGFIINEILEMMHGLRYIIRSPLSYLEQSYNNRYQEKEEGLIGIWHNDDDFGEGYSVYKSELAITKMAEKVSGALSFLYNLKQISNILPQISSSITEIKSMSESILPTINNTIYDIQSEIRKRRIALEDKKNELIQVEKKLDPHNAAIDKEHEEAQRKDKEENKKETSNISRYYIESIYSHNHTDYTSLNEEKRMLLNEISNSESDILRRESFISKLNECIEEIKKNND